MKDAKAWERERDERRRQREELHRLVAEERRQEEAAARQAEPPAESRRPSRRKQATEAGEAGGYSPADRAAFERFVRHSAWRLTKTEVLAWIHCWRFKSGTQVSISIDQLARLTQTNERSVRRAMHGLCRRKLLSRIKRGQRPHGQTRGTASVYVIRATPPGGWIAQGGSSDGAF